MAVVAATAAQLRAGDVDVERGDTVGDGQHERRHPRPPGDAGGTQLSRTRPEGHRPAGCVEQEAALRGIAMDRLEAVDDVDTLDHDDVSERVEQLLHRRTHAAATIVARELVAGGLRMLHVDIVCLVRGAAVTVSRGVSLGGRVLGSRRGYIAVLGVYMPAMLWLDGHEPHGYQYLVDVLTWLLLAAVFAAATAVERRQLVAVVAIATCLEILFSIVWGMYRYRYGNLPLYVPPGHGLIYLVAIRVAALRPIAEAPRRAAALVTVAVCSWVAGALVLPSNPDVCGLLLLPSLLYFLWHSGRTHVYAGAFIATTVLELVGTRFGNWRWAYAIPGLGISQGNPPAAIAAGYCILDMATLYAAGLPWLGRVPFLRARVVTA